MKKLSILLAASLLIACGSSDEPSEPSEQEGPGEAIQSELERDQSPSVAADTKAQLSADNRAFAFDLLHAIRDFEDDDNIFYSPHSISIALAMTYAGATGQTHEQMSQTLRFMLDEEELHPAFNALDLELATRSEVDVEDGDPPVLNVVNATWGQYDMPFFDDYLDTLAVHYGAGLRGVDFVSEPDEVRQRINQWVKDQTEERIKDLLPEGSVNSGTALVLTNAIYFLAGWHHEFDEDNTTDHSFRRRDGSEITVDMMRQTESFQTHLGDETHAISLPYVGEELSLIALKPADEDADYDAWEEAQTADSFDEVIDGLQMGHGDVALPRFRIEGDYPLKAIFEDMGWTNMFELGRLADVDGLEITDILHKSFIDLDEEGTEAAAATAVIIGEGSAPIADDFDLTFDRTFLYAIYDHPTDTILFMGRVDDPTEED